jgi:hypothetical protein
MRKKDLMILLRSAKMSLFLIRQLVTVKVVMCTQNLIPPCTTVLLDTRRIRLMGSIKIPRNCNRRHPLKDHSFSVRLMSVMSGARQLLTKA